MVLNLTNYFVKEIKNDGLLFVVFSQYAVIDKTLTDLLIVSYSLSLNVKRQL